MKRRRECRARDGLRDKKTIAKSSDRKGHFLFLFEKREESILSVSAVSFQAVIEKRISQKSDMLQKHMPWNGGWYGSKESSFTSFLVTLPFSFSFSHDRRVTETCLIFCPVLLQSLTQSVRKCHPDTSSEIRLIDRIPWNERVYRVGSVLIIDRVEDDAERICRPWHTTCCWLFQFFLPVQYFIIIRFLSSVLSSSSRLMLLHREGHIFFSRPLHDSVTAYETVCQRMSEVRECAVAIFVSDFIRVRVLFWWKSEVQIVVPFLPIHCLFLSSFSSWLFLKVGRWEFGLFFNLLPHKQSFCCCSPLHSESTTATGCKLLQ